MANLQVSRQDENTSDADTSIKDGKLLVGNDEPLGKLTITGGYGSVTGSATVTVVAAADVPTDPDTPTDSTINKNSINIKEKFGITVTGKAAVTATFTALHDFIQKGGLTDPDTNDVIKLGDYIDLEGGLKVDAYGSSATDATKGYFSWTVEQKPINPSPDFQGSKNNIPLLRLIVVGIDSFRTGKGYNNQYSYPAGEPAPPSHVVFQFQNIPVYRIMDSTEKVDGYGNSEMRKYLTPVGNDNTTGNFYKGLLAAGVLQDVLWAPARMLSTHGSGVEKISDLLWLPTEREMFPDGKDYKNETHSYANQETNTNQARLEYYKDNLVSAYVKQGYPKYDNNNTRQKSDAAATFQTYWLSSAGPSQKLNQGFCMVQNCASERNDPGNYRRGVVPAFCVQ
jgi:hypothetical protein